MKTIQTAPEAIEVRKAIEAKMIQTFGITFPVSISKTDFGTSIYIQNVGYGKIRISDHSVMNHDRIFNERHYSIYNILEDVVMGALMLDVEEIYYPERFETVSKEVDDIHYTHNIYDSVEQFKENTFNTVIESTRHFVNKSGRQRVEIYFHYPIKKTIWYRARKIA